MKIRNIVNYVSGDEIQINVLYNDLSEKMVIDGSFEVMVYGSLTVNKARLPYGRYSFENGNYELTSSTDGYVILGIKEKPKELEQFIPLQPIDKPEHTDYTHIVAVFEKWAHQRGLTTNIAQPQNVEIDDIINDGEDDDEFDLDQAISDYGIIEQSVEKQEGTETEEVSQFPVDSEAGAEAGAGTAPPNPISGDEVTDNE